MLLLAFGWLFKQAKSELTSASPINPFPPLLRKTGSGHKDKVTNQMVEAMRNALDKAPKLMAKALKDKWPILHEMNICTIQDALSQVMRYRSQQQTPPRSRSRPNFVQQPLEIF